MKVRQTYSLNEKLKFLKQCAVIIKTKKHYLFTQLFDEAREHRAKVYPKAKEYPLGTVWGWCERLKKHKGALGEYHTMKSLAPLVEWLSLRTSDDSEENRVKKLDEYDSCSYEYDSYSVESAILEEMKHPTDDQLKIYLRHYLNNKHTDFHRHIRFRVEVEGKREMMLARYYLIDWILTDHVKEYHTSEAWKNNFTKFRLSFKSREHNILKKYLNQLEAGQFQTVNNFLNSIDLTDRKLHEASTSWLNDVIDACEHIKSQLAKFSWRPEQLIEKSTWDASKFFNSFQLKTIDFYDHNKPPNKP